MPLCPMPRARARRSVAALLFAAFAVLVCAPPAGAVRMMNHNVLNWGGVSGVARVPYMQSIMRNVQPDLVVSQELADQGGVDLYLNSVLNFREPGQWQAAPFLEGPDTDSGLFYKTSKWTFLDLVVVPTELRNVYAEASYKSVVADMKKELERLRRYYKDIG